MRINTDLVKNKRYNTSITACLLKHSQEFRVLATLRYLFPDKYNAMVNGEAPDLQDCANSIGIEVTAAVKEKDMMVSRLFSELNKGTPKEIEKRKKTIESSGYTFVPPKNKGVAISVSGTTDGERFFIQESIKKKIKKLPQYRETFRTLGLAIILPEIPTTYAEQHIPEWISEVLGEMECSYDFVYVISHRFCIYYDAHKNSLSKHTLSNEESTSLITIGRMTAEGALSLSDVEWL
ncbi:MAG: hypothetical protein IKU23_00750 [Clostridia bacterium]|nr:hypothetical protein [Clostridia bacterium]